ncbi:DUF4435 domain-containing protein [Paenibacillus monticola]|uniref:DUF4435 domain-containing protein n=1 Tax=Paenibacillus monticola TaxID=2666075 RepID=A0A7X2H8U3_9BACL|nr:DUF4435 domain-containing protein [Paenibacillus monticola]MRN55588.1 DUF4435 domain-containing protein [Paenibacillus monticola]
MNEYITADRIANSIMQDSSFSGHHLIVEGIKDYKLYRKFMSENIRIKEAWGCEKVKETLSILEARGFDKKVGIIDSDFSKLLDIKFDIKDLFTTDFHDIEVMMIKSTALNTIVDLYCRREKVEKFNQGIEVSQILFDLGRHIGLLKLANKMYGLGLVFKPKELDGNQLKYRQFISESDLSFLGYEAMIQTVINYSRGRSPQLASSDDIKLYYHELSKNNFAEEQLVNGHDLTNIIFILFKKTLKSSNRMLADFNSIEDSLILSYEAYDFVNTKLFKDLLQWSIENHITLFKETVLSVYYGTSKELDKIAN